MNAILAYDPGYGNIKLYGPQGGLVLQSRYQWPALKACAYAGAAADQANRSASRPPPRFSSRTGRSRLGPTGRKP